MSFKIGFTNTLLHHTLVSGFTELQVWHPCPPLRPVTSQFCMPFDSTSKTEKPLPAPHEHTWGLSEMYGVRMTLLSHVFDAVRTGTHLCLWGFVSIFVLQVIVNLLFCRWCFLDCVLCIELHNFAQPGVVLCRNSCVVKL